MTIPLDTYDSNWEDRYEGINKALDAEENVPEGQANYDRLNDLLRQLREAFHAQFPTTGAFAEYMESQTRSFFSAEGVEDFNVPEFPRDASVEQTKHLSSTLSEKIRRAARGDRFALPLTFPPCGGNFSVELNRGDFQTINVISLLYDLHKNPPDLPPEFIECDLKEAHYKYLLEIVGDRANICFLQTNLDDPEPMTCLDELATIAYRQEFGNHQTADNHLWIPAEKVTFFAYVPPRVTGRESFFWGEMNWDAKRASFKPPTWHDQLEVPYVLRKLAFCEGLAKDPETPYAPRPFLRVGKCSLGG